MYIYIATVKNCLGKSAILGIPVSSHQFLDEPTVHFLGWQVSIFQIPALSHQFNGWTKSSIVEEKV